MNARVLRTGPASSMAQSTQVAEQIELVERRLEEVVASEVDTASDLSFYLLRAGGKRIRPTLVVLSAMASGAAASDPRVIDIATASELVHTASLVHDDVVDETNERRGVPTANDRWGNKTSVLGGDFLLAKGFSLLAEVKNVEVLSVLSATAVAMTESEMLQAASEGRLEAWRTNYQRIIQGKTASFLSACCECGAIIVGAAPECRKALAAYGNDLGLAFQITDDLLDIAGDPLETGKDIGADLMHGKFTYPVLAALDRVEGTDRDRLLSILSAGYLSPAQAREAAGIAADCGGVDESRAAAARYVERAVRWLGSLPQSDYTAALESLASSVATRDS